MPLCLHNHGNQMTIVLAIINSVHITIDRTSNALPHANAIIHLLVFAMTGDGECVGRQRGLRFRIVEMDDGAVLADHVHLLNARNIVDRHFLQRRLQLLVVGGSRLVDDLLLAARRPFSANAHGLLQFLQFFDIHGVASVAAVCV